MDLGGWSEIFDWKHFKAEIVRRGRGKNEIWVKWAQGKKCDGPIFEE